ncbi:MAG: hypothetical protein WCN95_16400 [bacterium]
MNRLATFACIGLLPAGCLIALGLTTQPSMPMVNNQPIHQEVTENVLPKPVSNEMLPSQTSHQVTDYPILKVWREKDASGNWVVKSCNMSETGAEIAGQ